MKDENDLIRDIKEHLDRSAEALDPEILSQIRAARYNALEGKRSGFLQWALPAGGIAVAAIAVFVSFNLITGPENRPAPQLADNIVTTDNIEPEPDKNEIPAKKNTESEIAPDQIELVEILSSDEHLEFFENLEFYAWLAENENITG